MPERHGYSVEFSSINPNLFIVATSQKYGRKGGATLFLLKILSGKEIVCLQSYEWVDALFDIGWCTSDLVCSASGDGSVQLWNVGLISSTTPTMCYIEHLQEVCSVDCSKYYVGTFVTSSWDRSVKLWNTSYSKSLSSYQEHSDIVYQTKFSPHLHNTFASVSGDGCLKIWNTNCSTAVATVETQCPEVLTCDWKPADPNVMSTGGSDGLLKLWDIRQFSIPFLQIFSGCTAIRRIRYSSNRDNVLASVSYDGITRIWDFGKTMDPVQSIQNHADSVFGLDWNPFQRNQIVDCGWDNFV
ncbi:Peroxisomal targeting signal 2 receptor, partial [Pseudolycoriella hygida]